MSRTEKWSPTLNPKSAALLATLSPTHSVLRKRQPLVIATDSRIEEDSREWAKLFPTEWFLSCPSGMIIPPTCFGLMLHTRQRRIHQSQVSAEAHALQTPENQLTLRRTLQMLPSLSPTSNGVLLAVPSRLLVPRCASRRILFIKKLHESLRGLLDLVINSLLHYTAHVGLHCR